VIESFKDKETEKIWDQQFSKKLPAEIQRNAYRKLVIIARSKNLLDLRIPPSNHLESLQGDRKGQYSIRINDQWRISFRFKEGNAFDVKIEDYH
jgi:proteic killer suppression protein